MKHRKHRLHTDLPPLSAGVPPAVKLYLRHLANAGKSKGTLRHYRDILTHFFGYFDGAEAATITTDMLNEFFSDERRRRAAATVNLTKAAVRGLYKYLLATEKITKDPSRLIESERVVNKSPGTFSAAQRDKLVRTIANAKGSPPQPGPMRDWMMVILAYNAGLRVAELVGVNIEDVENRRVVEVIGKGQKLRVLPINDTTRRALAEYLPWRRALRAADREALFVNRFGRRISTRAVERLLKTWLTKAGISGDFSPHSLRHSAATDLVRGGANIRVVQEFLGHASLETTKRYARVDDKDLRSAGEILG
ncbi:MAG: tyrosine-type recombinase/integrase [Elusimicrobia bacterium]|nr:tyrosine-type recombinase/integrase [Elusimicrobiota bacterium]